MANTVIPFGEWLPDQPTLGLQGSTVVTNALPDANAYKPMPSLNVFSTAVGGRVLGGIHATDAAGNGYNYAGDNSALYALSQQSFSTATRTVGGAYTTLGDDMWEFANWGNTIIAVNGHTDLPQQISLGGVNFANLSTGVKARHIAIMRDFVVLGNVSDSAANVYRVRWSAINNPGSFTADAATLSDYQDLPSEGGPVQRLIGGEGGGYVFQQRAITRMAFVGSPLVFQFDKVQSRIGAFSPQSVANYQNIVFFLSEDGFYAFDGNELDPIGRGKVDAFFRADLHQSYSQRVHAAIDPINKFVVWAYASNNSPQGNADKLIVYSWAYKKWSLITGLNVEYVLDSIASGYTLEGLDAISSSIDGLPVSLDSLQWTGGQVILSAFDSTHRLGRFNGSAMPATITTGEFQMHDQQRTMLTQARPIAIGLSASLSLAVLNRNNLTESVSTGAAAVTVNGTGFAPVRVSARYMNISLTVSGNFNQLLGVEVAGRPAGER